MKITIELDTAAELTELDRTVLSLLSGVELATLDTTRPGATTPPAKAAPAPKAAPKAAPKPEPTPEPEPVEETVEDLVGEAPAPKAANPTIEDAVAAATELVADGQQAKVKAALAEVGAARVSAITGVANIKKFLAALAA